MGNFFQGVFGAAQKYQKKIIPKELRKAVPKEIQGAYIDRKSNEAFGLSGQEPEQPPGIPPPEQIDADAFRVRDRQRRRARAASTVRTSAVGAPYSAAPKSLLGS